MKMQPQPGTTSTTPASMKLSLRSTRTRTKPNTLSSTAWETNATPLQNGPPAQHPHGWDMQLHAITAAFMAASQADDDPAATPAMIDNAARNAATRANAIWNAGNK